MLEIKEGEALFAGGKVAEAEEYFRNIIKKNPDQKEALNNLGVIAFMKNKPGEAASYFARTLKIDPLYKDAILNFCDLLRASDNLPNGIALLEMASEKYGDDEEIGNLLAEARLSQQAAEITTRDSLINASDNNDNSEIDKTDCLIEELETGKKYLATGKIAEAENRFKAALDIDGSNVDAICAMSVISHRNGNRVDAIDFLGRAIDMESNHKSIDNAAEEIFKDVSYEKLTALPDEAWLYLVTTISNGNIAQKKIDLLQKISEKLSDSQIEKLIVAFTTLKNTGVDQVIDLLMIRIGEISIDLAETLGRWVNDIDADRMVRDRIEMAICMKCHDDQTVRKVSRRMAAYRPDPAVMPGFETYPRKIVTEASSDDPFMKEVPQSAPSKKNGLRILLISDFNIAGQYTGLMRAINKYSSHMARCVIFNDDFLSYDKDVLINDGQGNETKTGMREAAKLIRGADFFHIGRQLTPVTGIKWEKYISPHNTIFQYHGSHLRQNGKAIAEFHARYGFDAITCIDWTIYRHLKSSFYHMHPCIIELDDLPTRERDFTGNIRICHAPSGENYRRIKRSDVIIDVMDRMVNENDHVEKVIIENVPNRECLERKSDCHIHIVSLMYAFGLNAIESAAMGVIPITGLDNFTRFIFHDTPVLHATVDSAYDVTKKLLSDKSRMKDLSESCKRWARANFDARVVAKKYTYLYDLIYHGLSVDYPEYFDYSTNYEAR